MLLGSRDYSKPTDVWSVGCILAELLMGKPIFPGTSTLHQLEKIIEFTGNPSKESIESLHSEVAESLINQLTVRKRHLKEYFQGKENDLVVLVCRMLEFNPHHRITIDEALKTPCLQEFAQKEDEHILNCQKFVVPCVDDNVKLTLQQYRKIIYQDIERRYPEENCIYQNPRSVGSFTKTKKFSLEDPKMRSPPCPPNLKRQKSVVTIKKSSSLLKKSDMLSPYRAVLQKEEAKPRHESPPLLKKTKSRKQLVRKKPQEGKPTKFKR